MPPSNFKKLMTLQDFLQFFTRYVKYWKLALFAACLGASLSIGYFAYGKPSYYSKCLVEYSYVDLPIKSEISDLRSNSRWDKIHLQIVGGLQSKWLAERVALRLGLVGGIGDLDTIWSRYLNKVKISNTLADQLEIEVWVYESRLAKLWPEAMLLEYHDFLTESRIKHRDNLVKGFAKEMDRIQLNIREEAEKDRKYESENQMLESYIMNNKLEQLPTEMLVYKSQLDAMQELEKLIEQTAPSPGEKLALLQKYRTTPLPTGTIVRRNETLDPFVSKESQAGVVSGANNQVEQSLPKNSTQSPITIVMPEIANRTQEWEDIESKLKSLEREYKQLSATLLPGHQKMRELTLQIEKLKFSLNVEWEKSYAAYQLEKTHLREKLDNLQKQMPEYRKLIAGYDDYRRDYRLQASGRIAWEQAYVAMKARLTAMDYTGPEVQVTFDMKGYVDVRDDIPVSPNKKKLLTYALALSLGFGLGAPVLTERLRFTSSFVNETERIAQYPACGIVPLLADIKDPSFLLSDSNSKTLNKSHVIEAFRIIRCSLPVHAEPANKLQVIMITSSRPSDGKTTISSLLAKSYADSGEKTLLIDADLRRGTLHKIFGLTNENLGLANILANLDLIEQAENSSVVKNLTVICRGRASESIYDSLAGQQMVRILSSLRERYDRIVIDTPPLLGIADSQMIRNHVDGVLLVIRADVTTQRDIATASEILHQTSLPVYGFVLNGVDFTRAENSYYYGHYYSRYYEPTYYTQLEENSSTS